MKKYCSTALFSVIVLAAACSNMAPNPPFQNALGNPDDGSRDKRIKMCLEGVWVGYIRSNPYARIENNEPVLFIHRITKENDSWTVLGAVGSTSFNRVTLTMDMRVPTIEFVTLRNNLFTFYSLILSESKLLVGTVRYHSASTVPSEVSFKKLDRGCDSINIT